MKTISPHLARILGRIGYTVGNLWDVHARLTALATAEHLAIEDVARAAREAAAELDILRHRLTEVVAALPAPSTDPPLDEDLELRPLELSRASVECVLTDRLEPAIGALSRTSSLPSSLEQARASLECLLADYLIPAIDGLLVALFVVHEEGSAHAYLP